MKIILSTEFILCQPSTASEYLPSFHKPDVKSLDVEFLTSILGNCIL